MRYINDLIYEGYSISTSSGPNSDIYMHDNTHMSWTKISSERFPTTQGQAALRSDYP